MRISTSGAYLLEFPVLFGKHGLPRTVPHKIQGTVAKQTVYIIKPLMAGIIFAFPVFKIAVGLILLLSHPFFPAPPS